MNMEASKELFIAQYEKLREEIHQRVGQRQDLLTYGQIGAASILEYWAATGVFSRHGYGLSAPCAVSCLRLGAT